jgi:alkylation response protein AidB-like acyl-CoA dehydrogenase
MGAVELADPGCGQLGASRESFPLRVGWAKGRSGRGRGSDGIVRLCPSCRNAAATDRGTGSHDVAVHGITVPEELTCSPVFDPPRHDGPLYRLSFFNLITAHVAGFPAGVGRRALDEFVVAAAGKHRPGAPSPVADDPVAQHRFAVVDSDLQAARAFFIEAIGGAWETVTRGDACSLRQRARVMSAAQVLQRAAAAAVDAVLPLAGASAVYADNPIQRCSRDLHAALQHIFFGVGVLRDIGQVALGGTPKAPRF